MRKAIEAFEKEFAPWGLTLPARDIVDRQPGHSDRHGWSLDYSFGSDAFGEYLEYHARRAVANEPVIERHARVYHNGERNFVPATAGAESDEPVFIQPDPAVKKSPAGNSPRRPTLPPFAAMVEEATTGTNRRPPSGRVKRVAPRPTARVAPREPSMDYSMGARHPRSSSWRRNRHTAMSFVVGVGAAVLVAGALVFGIKALRNRHRPIVIAAAADTAALEPVLVLAPAVLGLTTGTTSIYSQPMVGRPSDPNRAEIVRPERGMTPIIPSDPGTKKRKSAPAATSRGEKFHVP